MTTARCIIPRESGYSRLVIRALVIPANAGIHFHPNHAHA